MHWFTACNLFTPNDDNFVANVNFFFAYVMCVCLVVRACARACATATIAATTFFNHLINSKINYVQSNCSLMCNACALNGILFVELVSSRCRNTFHWLVKLLSLLPNAGSAFVCFSISTSVLNCLLLESLNRFKKTCTIFGYNDFISSYFARCICAFFLAILFFFFSLCSCCSDEIFRSCSASFWHLTISIKV